MKRIITLLSILTLSLAGCGSNPPGITFYLTDEEFETYYDDSYFLLDNKYYHQEIAVASFANAMASINARDDYSIRSANLVDLWTKENFQHIYINDDYKVKPTLDSVGFAIASKKINNFNLIAVTIRSGAYDAEWASNVTAGTTGNSQGFQNSANKVIEGIEDYVSTYELSGHTKFWLSGFSRGGSITNLLAGTILQQIDQGTFIDQITTSIADVYAYCFEPQNAAEISIEDAKGELYQGIHNLCNFNDILTMILPNVWGMVKYGHSHYYPDRLTDIRFNATERKKMIWNYHFAKGAEDYAAYTVDDWKFYRAITTYTEEINAPVESIYPSMGRFAQNLIYTIMISSLDRSTYAMFQEGIRNIFATIFGYNPDIEGIKISDSVFMDLLFSYSIIQTLFSELQQGNLSDFTADFEIILYILFNANKDNIDAIHALYEGIRLAVFYIFAPIIFRPDVMHQLFSRDNMLTLISTHATELNYSFLKSCDPRLYGKDACHLNDGTYYILKAETPESISIYEKTLGKNVFTYSNGVMSSDTLSAEKMYDGSIAIYMPKNGNYNYHIESEDIQLINVDEYNNETVINDSMPKTGEF